MNSAILNSLGLGNIDPGIWLIVLAAVLVLSLVLLVVVIVQGNKLRKQKERIDRLTDGSDGASLESSIQQIFEEQSKLREKTGTHDSGLTDQRRQLSGCIQKMGLIKYDAFNQMGGKLSYALALLDEEDNGVIINSVHSNEGCYTYAKEVRAGKSEIDLAAEESQALQRALAN